MPFLRGFLPRQVLKRKDIQIRGTEYRAGPRNHRGCDTLTPFSVGHSEHRHIQNIRMAQQHGLYPFGMQFGATTVDDIVTATRQVKITFGV